MLEVPPLLTFIPGLHFRNSPSESDGDLCWITFCLILTSLRNIPSRIVKWTKAFNILLQWHKRANDSCKCDAKAFKQHRFISWSAVQFPDPGCRPLCLMCICIWRKIVRAKSWIDPETLSMSSANGSSITMTASAGKCGTHEERHVHERKHEASADRWGAAWLWLGRFTVHF